MHDFDAVIRHRLPVLWLGRDREEDVAAELAAHLEDSAEHGVDVVAMCADVNWARFSKQIRHAKEGPMDRMEQILIPTLAAMAISALIQLGLYFLGLRTFLFPASNTAFVLQWPWLLTLPLAGGMGAYLARRAGASPWRRVLAALAPAWLMLATFVVVSVPAIIIGDLRHASNWIAFATIVFSWVIIPAAPLLVCALPFLGGAGVAQPRHGSLVTSA